MRAASRYFAGTVIEELHLNQALSTLSGGELLYSGVPFGVMSEPRSVTRQYLLAD
ncbi:MAG TPA: hypothetical protein IAC05_06170 [Candidatus Coprenecus stercorigallinarum]|nr:hypothetical protein [Candidatus Coprenecus stercorigallinarum]